jgi:hypothetical protein
MATPVKKVANNKKKTAVKKTAKRKVYQNNPQGASYKEEKDKKIKAKQPGWRYTNAGAERLRVDKDSVPTTVHIDKYRGRIFKDKNGTHRFIYMERRKDKSDIRRKAPYLKDGGEVVEGIDSLIVYGYETKHFPTGVVALFKKIIEQFDANPETTSEQRVALSNVAMELDKIFHIEDDLREIENIPLESIHFGQAIEAVIKASYWNYRTGLAVNLFKIIPYHIESIASKINSYDEMELIEEIEDVEPKFETGGQIKPKYKIGDNVYSYQNESAPAPINYVRFSPWLNDGSVHKNDLYKYRLTLPEGNSKWINENSLRLTKEKGGHIGFNKLANEIAAEYEGEPVKKKYQGKYGKTYSKKEAQEVGKAVAAKVANAKKGEKKKSLGSLLR